MRRLNNKDITFLSEICGEYEQNPREITQKCELLRRLSNIKLKTIADEIGVNPRTITRFEKGITRNYSILRFYVNKFGQKMFEK